ncbi:TetR/AcrR family transcriptional regulator C-terminal domain-containing protein [Streptomyces qinzhouensis]|uniref:TetR/AcrR family transcriptional regulator n=1 Tax=Streptomyces qinzhouensis TaxID=2599401 RepID=A0A5B8JIU9_9ACTN|nr:TetR/AcrR family transcriptional regulator C-terminal domain-containing protein [Streptomyces qinzhouensis]QDY80334.1 TetR/AcrR family transcriptional regulator [Streptomyces qinzhouensis]
MGEIPTRRGGRPKRTALSRERVIAAAVALADEKGESGVTMRALATGLGVEAMSLYNHVRNRDDILDGMVDAVFALIELPPPAADWKTAMRDRAASARAALRAHPWAVGLMDSRSRPGPATLHHHDAVLGALRTGGFSVPLAARAVAVIDSFVYGSVLQELSLPFTAPGERDAIATAFLPALSSDTHPHLAELVMARAAGPEYDYAEEFAFGLSLILDALRPDEQGAYRPR